MPEKKKNKTKKYSNYAVSEKSVSRKKKFCPKCGPDTFLAEHKNRHACGKCSYTEWKSQ